MIAFYIYSLFPLEKKPCLTGQNTIAPYPQFSTKFLPLFVLVLHRLFSVSVLAAKTPPATRHAPREPRANARESRHFLTQTTAEMKAGLRVTTPVVRAADLHRWATEHSSGPAVAVQAPSKIVDSKPVDEAMASS